MLTWILGYFWSLSWGVSAHLVWGHALERSSRTVAAVSHFPSRGSRDLWLSLEAFPQGCPTRDMPWWSEWILGVKVEAVQGKQVPLEWTETSGVPWNCGKTLEFLSPFLLRAPLLEMRRESREFFPDEAGKESLISSYEVETRLLWMWAGPSCFLSSGDWYVGELLELQQACEGPFGSSRG